MGLQASSNIVISYRSFRSQFKLIGLWFRMVNWLVERPVMWILKKKKKFSQTWNRTKGLYSIHKIQIKMCYLYNQI